MSYLKNPMKLLLGSDCELLGIRKGSTTGYLRGENLVIDDDNNPLNWGVDGSGGPFELRPDPSECPIQHVNNIRSIFNYQFINNPKFADYDYLAGSYQRGQPLGGHIHFGFEDKKNVEPRRFSGILSQYVGVIGILIEDKNQGYLRRRHSDYGGMYDYRDDLDYGFEYRTPGSWLTSPYIACAMLSLAKTVMYEILNNKNFKPENNAVEDDFRYMHTEQAITYFPAVWESIVKMKLYQEYKPYIDLLYYLVTNKLNWFPKGDIKSVWGLVDMRKAINKNKFTMNTIWARYRALENTIKTN